MAQSLTYAWPRFVSPREGTYSLGDNGFLVDPLLPMSQRLQPNVVPISRVTDYRCVVLLGEPGSGKTFAVRDLRPAHNSGVAENRYLQYNLASYSSDNFLYNSIFLNTVFTAWRNSETEILTLILDSFDECLLSIETLVTLLGEELGQLPCERLRLRVACRSAVWPRSLEQRLQSLYGEANVKVFELLPLRRADVVAAAVAEDVDPEIFLREVANREAIPLAIRPITLKFLLRAFRDHQGLPASQVDLYRQGCEHLCRELSDSRIASSRTGALTIGQRFTVASRIAAITMICRRPIIDNTPGGAVTGGESLSLRDLIGGRDGADGLKFDVTETAIRETLDTGLFTARGPGLLGFAHQTYAEFLAAYYVVNRLSHDQLLQFVTHQSDTGTRVVPQLQEIAAWLASLDPALFPRFLAIDPPALLGCDLAGMTPEFRVELVNGLLSLARDARLLDHVLGLRARYSRLAHPGLAAQIRPTIIDRTALPTARHAAIDIAESCNLHELLDILTDITINPVEDYYTRVQSGYAVARIGDGDATALNRLRPCLTGDVGDDPDDSLKGIALRALFPTYLSASEVFAVLTMPKRENYYAAYAGFYTSHLPEHLGPAHLPDALCWLATQSPHISQYIPWQSLVERILLLSLDHLDNRAILTAYVPLVATYIREFVSMPGLYGPEADSNPGRRWRGLDAILPGLREVGILPQALIGASSPLFSSADAVPLIDRTIRERDLAMQDYLAQITNSIHGYDADATNRMVIAARECPALARVFSPRLSPMHLNSEDARERREGYGRFLASEREWRQMELEGRRPAPNPAPTERIAALLADFESGNLQAWWRLIDALGLYPDGRESDAYEPDITTLPGWLQAAPETRTRIIRAAEKYLTDVEPHPAEWIGSDQFDRHDCAGLRALWLLDREALYIVEAFVPEVWRRWGPVVLGYPSQVNNGRLNRHSKLARQAYLQAPDTITEAIDQIFDRGASRGWVHIHDLLRGWLDETLAALLLRHVRNNRLGEYDRNSILDMLIKIDYYPTILYLISLVTDSPPSDPISLRRQQALEAARFLCQHNPTLGWPEIWALVCSDVAFGRDLFIILSSRAGLSHYIGTTIANTTSEHSVVELYIWLISEFSQTDSPDFAQSQAIERPDNLSEFRDALLAGLQNRGTSEAVAAIERLAQTFPARTWLRATAEMARRAAITSGWLPPSPAQFLQLVADRSRRFVENGDQLLTLLRESLERLQSDLQGETPAAPDLWNMKSSSTYTPKDEAHLSDYICRHLRRDLRERAVVVNREVQIRRGEGKAKGEHTDIHVDAIKTDHTERRSVISIIIEVKGCWNRTRESDLADQLFDRYLRDNQCRHGLYVVGWFTCDQWDRDDRIARRGPTETADEARDQFDTLAREASRDGARIEAFILNAALR